MRNPREGWSEEAASRRRRRRRLQRVSVDIDHTQRRSAQDSILTQGPPRRLSQTKRILKRSQSIYVVCRQVMVYPQPHKPTAIGKEKWNMTPSKHSSAELSPFYRASSSLIRNDSSEICQSEIDASAPPKRCVAAPYGIELPQQSTTLPV